MHEEMCAVCTQAGKIDPLNEQLHILVLHALLLQNEPASALLHYEKVTRLLHDNLGVRPSEEMQRIYLRIISNKTAPEENLGNILRDMKESKKNSGAFLCELNFFETMYRLEARRAARDGGCLHVALITLSPLPEEDEKTTKAYDAVMENLQNIVVRCLRQSDVVSRYSKSQLIVMLPDANPEDSEMVMGRIKAAFQSSIRGNAFSISHKLHGLEIT